MANAEILYLLGNAYELLGKYHQAVKAWQEAASGEQRERVLRAVRRLPLKYREVIVLHYLEELPYERAVTATSFRGRASAPA